MDKVAALFVISDGCYSEIPKVELYDIIRDAKTYRGPYPVIAHPPCARWGRYWSGGPFRKKRYLLGDDAGSFAFSLFAVRTWGGVIEHPEASHAFKYYGLPKPDYNGGWTEPDSYGGRSCCVAQGHYGHSAQKMTWLYAVLKSYPKLKWGRCKGLARLDDGYHSKEERARSIKRGVLQRLSKRQRQLTPKVFANVLVGMVKENLDESPQPVKHLSSEAFFKANLKNREGNEELRTMDIKRLESDETI